MFREPIARELEATFNLAGAITTLYQRCGDLPRVRWYGRWDSLRTMEHYVQELPQAAVFAELGATTRAQAPP